MLYYLTICLASLNGHVVMAFSACLCNRKLGGSVVEHLPVPSELDFFACFDAPCMLPTTKSITSTPYGMMERATYAHKRLGSLVSLLLSFVDREALN